MNESSAVAVDEIKKPEPIKRPESFDNARLVDESWEDYKARRLQIKKFLKQKLWFKSEGEDNRAKRRHRKPLRLTKSLRKVRNKWMVGQHDVTHAIKHGIPLHQYLRVAEMGFDVSKLTELGKQIELGIQREKELEDGNISN